MRHVHTAIWYKGVSIYIRVHGKLWSLAIATCRVQGDEFMEGLCGVWGELREW